LIKDRLFAILSHDLRNPLAALKTYLSLSHSALDETKKEKYRVLTEDAVTSTSNLLDNLLVWANLQLKNIKPNISSLVINEVLDDVLSNIHPIAYKKNIEFVKNISLENIHSNSSILLIALQNLIINAIKFSYQDSKIFINVFKIENNIVIEIQDTGTGMSQKKIDEIFQAKAAYSLGTSGEKGSGLGLFLTIQLLEKINAKLKIESKEGEGSKISIILV
jgi:signal transduction histidine kinase